VNGVNPDKVEMKQLKEVRKGRERKGGDKDSCQFSNFTSKEDPYR
jgi:hypothetical protein